ncbi:hypothetical protein [Ramlibacter alkalitolerans]|uniref:DUF4124 domain-containing protein n=1 Tax=Ramlibacter alkalitolerans TaxID=2039631 RepID=A0ABS1JS50_9BURK|nr:hypothetical protein [Ramlibacter alkalitolerans]MBL0426676.1 hypothetical protein [Ramlibacter alkalitolerans]
MTTKTLVLVLALCAGSAGAQTVWRCGNSYSQEPCAGGKPVTVSEPVTGRALALPVASNPDARLAAEMEKARLAQERNAPKALVIGPVEAPPLQDAGKEKKDGAKAKDGKPEQFTAVSPGQPKEKKAKGKKKKSG